MNKNLILEYHCSCCRYRQHWSINIEKDKAICVNCRVKEKKFFMDEFANGMFTCSLQHFCDKRRSQMLAMTNQQTFIK